MINQPLAHKFVQRNSYTAVGNEYWIRRSRKTYTEKGDIFVTVVFLNLGASGFISYFILQNENQT